MDPQLQAALDSVVDPLIGRGLVAAGAVKSARSGGGKAQVSLELGFPAAGYRRELVGQVRRALREKLDVEAEVEVGWAIQSHAVQRNLKALGTFGYQTLTRNNTVYIQYMPRTLRYVRANLERYPRFARLRELLAAHLEELR